MIVPKIKINGVYKPDLSGLSEEIRGSISYKSIENGYKIELSEKHKRDQIKQELRSETQIRIDAIAAAIESSDPSTMQGRKDLAEKIRNSNKPK